MATKLILALVIGFLPLHDFHTSLMNITYEDDKKSFEIDLTVDTEHFEEAINATYYTDIRVGELDEHDPETPNDSPENASQPRPVHDKQSEFEAEVERLRADYESRDG